MLWSRIHNKSGGIVVKTMFVDESKNIIVSGDEDGLVSIWDLSDISLTTQF